MPIVPVAQKRALSRPTPFAPEANGKDAAKANLYEWTGGQLRLVNVLPNGESIPGAAFGSGAKLSEEKTDLHFQGYDFSHAISADGSRIFWSSAKSGQVYLRINGEETLEVLDHEGQFVTASADGSKVLLSDGCLYDVEAESCTDLNGSEEGFEGILGQSEDLSSIYFLDTAALTAPGEENANGEHAVKGANNLYSWRQGSLSFVASLAKEDQADWTIAPIKRSAEASPDGRWLAFLSQVPLSGAENIGPCLFSSQKPLSGPCPEAFLLDASSGELTCASCDRSGEAPLGPTFLPRLGILLTSPSPQPRYLTDSGRLFFDSRDSLSPFDTNGNAERNPESDTTTAPDTVSAPNTIAKGCNPFCGDSRNTLASSRKGDELRDLVIDELVAGGLLVPDQLVLQVGLDLRRIRGLKRNGTRQFPEAVRTLGRSHLQIDNPKTEVRNGVIRIGRQYRLIVISSGGIILECHRGHRRNGIEQNRVALLRLVVGILGHCVRLLPFVERLQTIYCSIARLGLDISRLEGFVT